jgi:hypothetical protein
MRWRLLLIHWVRTEALFTNDDYKLPKWRWSLRRRIAIATAVYLTFSLMEHGWFLISDIYKIKIEIETCNLTDVDPVKLFITRHLAFILDNLPFRYNHGLGFTLEYLNFSYTFYWNFLNLFIILASIGIGFLYEQINTRLKHFYGLLVNESVWAEIRLHHVRVTELLRRVNSHCNEMLMVACFNDAYFTLCQMINITT